MQSQSIGRGCAIFLAICLYVISVKDAAASGQHSEFWTVEEFLSLNAAERNKSRLFSIQVRNSVNARKPIEKAIKIGIIYPGQQVSDYWRRSVSSLEGRLKELLPNYELQSFFTTPDAGIREQSLQLGKYLNSGVDYLIFTLNAARHRGIIQRTLMHGKTKLILQNITTPLKFFGEKQPFQYVGFDHAIGTKILVEKYLSETGGEADYAILYGPKGYVSEMRGGTFLTEMQKVPGMRLKGSYYVGFNRKKAYIAALDVIASNPDLKFIFSCSTDIALGVIDALRETGNLGRIKTNGWGGGSSELAAIAAGELDFTVMRMNDDNGVAMAEAMYLDQMDRRKDVPLIFSGDMVLVDGTMKAGVIGKLKKRAFRYSK